MEYAGNYSLEAVPETMSIIQVKSTIHYYMLYSYQLTETTSKKQKIFFLNSKYYGTKCYIITMCYNDTEYKFKSKSLRIL